MLDDTTLSEETFHLEEDTDGHLQIAIKKEKFGQLLYVPMKLRVAILFCLSAVISWSITA